MSALGIGLGALGGVLQAGINNSTMGAQLGNQMRLNEQAARLARENWDYTNVGNQIKHMKKAGLNIGLMYGQGGAGGQSNTGSGGSAAMAQTPDIMGLMQGQANIELMKAQAEKAKAEAEKIGGVDTEKANVEIQNIMQGTKGIELDNALKSGNMENVIRLSEEMVKSEEIKNNNLDNQMKTEISNKVMDTMLKEMQIKTEDQKVKESIAKIAQGWKDLEQKNRGLDIEQQKANIQEFTSETQRNYPSIMNTTGNILNDAVKTIYRVFGIDKENSGVWSKRKEEK